MEDNSAIATADLSNQNRALQIRHLQVPNCKEALPPSFLDISFTHHRTILESVKDLKERLFYVEVATRNHYSVETLKRAIREDDYHHQGILANNFEAALDKNDHAKKAILSFKDEYLLDFINVEPLGMRDKDIDERMVENGIVQNIKEFILKFGRDFAFCRSRRRRRIRSHSRS